MIYFISDTFGVFDQLHCSSFQEAETALMRNRFKRLSEDMEAQNFISPPDAPFNSVKHQNGEIYSSGRFWK